MRFIRGFFEAGKPAGAICHGRGPLVEADVVRGRTLPSYSSLATDIGNAGGILVDHEIVVDQGLATSRNPVACPRSAPRSSRSLRQAGIRAIAPEPVTVRPLDGLGG